MIATTIRSRPAAPGRPVPARWVGAAALGFSVLYFLSDVVEGVDGGFSTPQLWLTLIAEAALPVFVLGLAAVQRPRLGRLGWLGAAAYAAAYVFFTATVVYALVDGTPDFDALGHDLAPWMTIGGAVMVLAGLAFGLAVRRAGVLPRWTGVALMVGVVLDAATQGAPELVQLLAAGTRDLAFAGMGAALLRGRGGETGGRWCTAWVDEAPPVGRDGAACARPHFRTERHSSLRAAALLRLTRPRRTGDTGIA